MWWQFLQVPEIVFQVEKGNTGLLACGEAWLTENVGLPGVASGFPANPEDQRDNRPPAQPQVGLAGQLPLQKGGGGVVRAQRTGASCPQDTWSLCCIHTVPTCPPPPRLVAPLSLYLLVLLVAGCIPGMVGMD